MMISVIDRVENIVGKILAGYQPFLLFFTMLFKAAFFRAIEPFPKQALVFTCL